MIKVLIVDDSALIRQTFKALLESDPEIQVIGTANDPYIAVQKIQKEKPDVITLDIEMPRMDGLTFLRKLMSQAPMPVIVISNQTVKGADIALKAIETGAVDVMGKPNLSSEAETEESRIRLIDKIRSAYKAKILHREKLAKNVSPEKAEEERNPIKSKSNTSAPNAIVAVGASTGGTDAIKTFLEGLPSSIPPILIVQHMPEKFTTSFAKRLDELLPFKVKEAEDGEALKPNTVYIAPGNFHMTVMESGGKLVIKTSSGELVNRHRPSVNVLFNSIAQLKKRNTVGIVLTGMGDDGATGLLAMHQNGSFTIAQDETTSVVYGMPLKAKMLGGASAVLPLQDISSAVCEQIFAME